jgi:hypothetical protein
MLNNPMAAYAGQTVESGTSYEFTLRPAAKSTAQRRRGARGYRYRYPARDAADKITKKMERRHGDAILHLTDI